MERKNSLFYPALALSVSLTAFAGFALTYLGPLAAGTYPAASWAVHAHGVVYLAWCAFFPVQAALASHKFNLHRALGFGSLALVAAMTFTGFLVIGVKTQEALSGEGPDFWKAFSVPITADLLIFLGFYSAALLNRRRPDWHKRLMIIAAATVISAATWRLWIGAFGFHDWAMPAALASTKIFIVAGMMRDFASSRIIHPAWWIGLAISGGLETASFMIVGTPLEEPIYRAIASFADLFGWMY